jgi:ABC-type bacteriocin/lantibiotic exporter with double-glycine peptidase domain
MVGLNDFKQCFTILSSQDKKQYFKVAIFQSILGVLDLIGIAVIGIIGLITLRGFQSQELSGKSLELIKLLNLANFSFQSQVATLGILAAFVLILRTILSLYLNWRVMYFLSTRSVIIAEDLLSKLIGKGQINFHNKSISEIQHILGPGVFAIATGVLGTASTLIADISSVLMISITIILIDPLIGVVSILLFSIVGIFLYYGLRKRVEAYGKEFSNQSISVNRSLQELFAGYRQIYSANRTSHYLKSINSSRSRIAKLYAINSFIPGLGKYVIEVTIILGGLLIAASLFHFSDTARAIAGLGIFIASGARVAPALLRLQQGLISIKSNLSISYLTIDLLKELKNETNHKLIETKVDYKHEDFDPRLELSQVIFKHANNSNFKLSVENLRLDPGSFMAIVGPSGSGKTTLVDLILGLVMPNSGYINVSGMNPGKAISSWPGAISYVPQDIYIAEGSIKSNVALGFEPNEIIDDYVLAALDTAQLRDYVSSLPDGINTVIRERGNNLSGGQRQRIGVARALYTKPKLLILDEATSSLDGISEEEISLAISRIPSNLTRIVIAHRLSTVRFADQVIYLSGGEILAKGNFEQVRELVPDFDKTAGLLGL